MVRLVTRIITLHESLSLACCSTRMTMRRRVSVDTREQLWAALLDKWGPAVPPPDDGQASATARAETVQSVLHQLDLQLRQAMGKAVALLGDSGAGRAGQHLSEARRAVLGRARARLGEEGVREVVEGAEAEFAERCAAFVMDCD